MIDIFVPVYNEGKNIKKLFDSMQENIRSEFEVLIVYDTETDDTLPVINDIRDNYTFPIRLEKNHYGSGALNAFKTGMESIKHEYLVFTMADLSDSLETVDIMLSVMNNGYDVVAGSRYIKGGSKIGGPKLKTFFSLASGWGMHFLIGIPLHDISNGFKMYRQEVIHNIQLDSSVGFEIGLELTLKAYLEGYKMTEVPAQWINREVGVSNFPMWKWIPHYLRWCLYAIKVKWFGKTDKNRRQENK